jgi:single-strand DNA-binding protein
MFLNRVILIGRIVTDIGDALKYTPSGIPVLQFRLAVDRPMSAEARQNGQPKQTDFITIVAWRQSAEFAANYLGKGRLVAVEGQLHIREFEHEGQKRREAEVVSDNLKSLEWPKEGEEGAQGGGSGGYNRGAQGGGTGYSQGGRGGGREGSADGGEDAFEAPPAPARAQAAPPRAQAAPPRPASGAPARPAAGGGGRNYQPPAEDDMDDPFADN